MLEPLQRTALPDVRSPMPQCVAVADSALMAGWREGLAIVNLRGVATHAPFLAAASGALGLELPVKPCRSVANATLRVVGAGPDEWFVIGPKGQAGAIGTQLDTALSGMHHAVTDVSSGYAVLHLSGAPVREVLAQGCPLDLHPRAFEAGMSAGSHYFKTSILLWQTDSVSEYEVLVRSSFKGYFWLMLERSTQEHGLVRRRFA